MEKSDNHIVKQIKQGDIEAYSELVQRYQQPVFNLMFRFSRSKSDAAELTQDVFCKAFEKLDSFQNKKTFFPWLYSLAMNHGKDWIRRQQRERDGLRFYADNLAQEGLSPPVQIIEKRQEINTMFMALAKLPLEKQEILLLRYQQELSIRELEEIFCLSASAVKMRIHRSLALLHDQLNGECDVNERR